MELTMDIEIDCTYTLNLIADHVALLIDAWNNEKRTKRSDTIIASICNSRDEYDIVSTIK